MSMTNAKKITGIKLKFVYLVKLLTNRWAASSSVNLENISKFNPLTTNVSII